MKLLKRTYSLSPDSVSRFEKAVKPGRRSTVINELVRKWLEDQEREALRAQVIEGCKAMSEENLEMEREFHPLEEEIHRDVEP